MNIYDNVYERKLLALGQKRIGPNIIGYYGLLQHYWMFKIIIIKQFYQ